MRQFVTSTHPSVPVEQLFKSSGLIENPGNKLADSLELWDATWCWKEMAVTDRSIILHITETGQQTNT